MRKAELNSQLDSTATLKTVRGILLSGFGGMLLLMVLAGAHSLRDLRRLNAVSNEVTQRFAARSHALITVVVSFHAYADQMEEYLLSDAIVSDVPAAEEITTRGAAAHVAIAKYPQNGPPEERLLLSQIERGVATEEDFFRQVLSSSNAERRQRGHSLVYERLMPQRTKILQFATALTELNTKQYDRENRALAEQFQGLRTRLRGMILLTLLAGVLLSLVAGYYILRLEQAGGERYLALANSRQELAQLSRRLVDVQEAERRAISRELHDEVGQLLGALLLDVAHLSKLISPEDKIAQDQVGRIRTAADTAVKAIRDIALLLRPPMLDDLGLVPALEWQARETSRRSDIQVEVHAEELRSDPPDAVKVCIYRVVQEALQNAASHARAKNAKVVVKAEAGSVVVDISDDGEGFQPDRTRGMGILGMEERVRQLGGVFFLRSAPGKGTVVHVELPLDSAGIV